MLPRHHRKREPKILNRAAILQRCPHPARPDGAARMGAKHHILPQTRTYTWCANIVSRNVILLIPESSSLGETTQLKLLPRELLQKCLNTFNFNTFSNAFLHPSQTSSTFSLDLRPLQIYAVSRSSLNLAR